jgi:hypothetical protein
MMPKDGLLSKQHDALVAGWSAAVQAVDVSHRAPLSARHALHAAVLIDQLSDLAFARRAELLEPLLATSGDFLAFRTTLRARERALGLLMDMTGCRVEGPHLQLIAAQVAPDDFANLEIADLMVSLYNAGTVPRLMLVHPDGALLPMQDILHRATNWWRVTLAHKLQ